MDDLCQFLKWDTEFFGQRIARVIPTLLTPAAVEQILAWCEAQQIECLYLLAEPDDQETVYLAEDHGFRFVDIRVVLECTLKGVSPAASFHIRDCTEADLPTLRAIAAASYQDSRFYYDPHFPTAKCDALYETWIERSCAGYAEAVLVAEVEDQPAGFISCHLEPDFGKIGLVGVSEMMQGKGIGRDLMTAALSWFVSQGKSRVTVATQGRNIGAQQFYQKSGFITRSVQLWYHRWFKE